LEEVDNMSKGKILVIDGKSERTIPLEESGYVKEALLQEYLASYPALLPGSQINPENPRRWLLVSREMGVPGDVDEIGRWCLDHLFLDQDGIPTFVETKRSSDTRIRREVVAQMLDYAANGVEYWDIERIRQVAAESAKERGVLLDDEVIRLLEIDDAESEVVDNFWEDVEKNLKSHRVRLLFVSDFIPKELRRLVEFLNEEMKNAEVLAVEVKQYIAESGEDIRALVPRLIGYSEAARIRKGTSFGSKPTVTRDSFMDASNPDTLEFFSYVLDTAIERGFSIYWGKKGFSVRGEISNEYPLVSFIQCYPPNEFWFYFHPYGVLPRDKDNPIRKELMQLGVFSERGDYSLIAKVFDEKVEELVRSFDYILDMIQKIEKEKHEWEEH